MTEHKTTPVRVLVATPLERSETDTNRLVSACRNRLPAFMVPERVVFLPLPLPRSPNGKIDRQSILNSVLGESGEHDES